MDDPDAHFKKLKAKIALKANKQYQEDVIREQEEKQRVEDLPVEIKDKYGRVIEKQYLKLKSKKVPSMSRKPRKRPPLLRKRSFVADQKKYDDIEKCYDPMANLEGPSLIDKITIEVMKRL